MNEEDRLASLYESLESVREQQDEAWTSGGLPPAPERTQEDQDTFRSIIRGLELDEDALLEQIHALGGEDPDL